MGLRSRKAEKGALYVGWVFFVFFLVLYVSGLSGLYLQVHAHIIIICSLNEYAGGARVRSSPASGSRDNFHNWFLHFPTHTRDSSMRVTNTRLKTALSKPPWWGCIFKERLIRYRFDSRIRFLRHKEAAPNKSPNIWISYTSLGAGLMTAVRHSFSVMFSVRIATRVTRR